MDISSYSTLAIKVLLDPRVLGVMLVVLLSWVLFRFVGIIVNRTRRPPKVLRGAAPPPEEVKAKRERPEPEIED